MKVSNVVQDRAVLSNVGTTGEFRIRNSSKAFSILSSGLYANKIRAIIRELSTNAYDSHVAAGRGTTPFDVHLPSTLEPWFSIRDYGVGLSHDEVVNIYTTYFESTKTDSNDYVGALGLGSKSPFSYTDNFTVIAIRHGQRGIYTAFISDTGIPCIALMMQSETTEPSGVEVRFGVQNTSDFQKFQMEAQEVYRYFGLRPVVSGGTGPFQIPALVYQTRDLIPGVHVLKPLTQRDYTAHALMGNIVYPIQMPQGTVTEGLATYLTEPLLMEFDIGELDIQASREGLSYVPETVAIINAKLQAVREATHDVIARDMAEQKNFWEGAYYLTSRSVHSLWRPAVQKYAEAHDIDLNAYNHSVKNLSVAVQDLEAWNLEITAFLATTDHKHCKSLDQSYLLGRHWQFAVDARTQFVDATAPGRGAINRAKKYFREECGRSYRQVFVLRRRDAAQPCDIKAFWAAVKHPPAEQVYLASEILDTVKTSPRHREAQARYEFVKLCVDKTYKCRRRSEIRVVWDPVRPEFQADQTYYYVHLHGYKVVGRADFDIKDLAEKIYESRVLNTDRIYGVRDLAAVRDQPNWQCLFTALTERLTNFTEAQLLSLQGIDKGRDSAYTHKRLLSLVKNPESPVRRLARHLDTLEQVTGLEHLNAYQTLVLMRGYAPERYEQAQSLRAEVKTLQEGLDARYPLMARFWQGYHCDSQGYVEGFAEYINAIDALKGQGE